MKLLIHASDSCFWGQSPHIFRDDSRFAKTENDPSYWRVKFRNESTHMILEVIFFSKGSIKNTLAMSIVIYVQLCIRRRLTVICCICCVEMFCTSVIMYYDGWMCIGTMWGQRQQDALIKSFLGENFETCFRRNNDVIIAWSGRWEVMIDVHFSDP